MERARLSQRDGRDGAKLAAQARDGGGTRGTRTRRRPNGDSLSSRGSTATGMQCGLCAVVTGLFRRAMCIAGSRRGSGESCYQELATDSLQGVRDSAQVADEQQQQLEQELEQEQEQRATEAAAVAGHIGGARENAERVKDVAQAHEVRVRTGEIGLDYALLRPRASCPFFFFFFPLFASSSRGSRCPGTRRFRGARAEEEERSELEYARALKLSLLFFCRRKRSVPPERLV